jgi:VWFA-related protein
VSRIFKVGYAVAGLLVFLASSNLVLAQAGPRQQNANSGVPTFRTQANEVQITFAATDQNDRVIATLNASDFAVVDKDFIVRTFRSFRRAEYTRLDVAILLDNSDSITSRFQQELAQTINLISETSGVPEGSFSIVSFQGAQPAVICQGNCRGNQTAKLVSTSSHGAMTPLFDTLAFTADLLSQKSDSQTPDPKVRKVAIVISDGEDTISRRSAGEAVAELVANDVHVYTLDVNRLGSSNGGMFLKKLAYATGGQSFRLSDKASAVADAVLADFQNSYQVTYRLPDSSTGFHSIRILPTHNLNLNFRCRQGYVDPSGR